MIRILALAAAPLCAGLLRYSVAYGYEGLSRHEAWGQTWRVTAMVAFFCGLLILAGCATPKPACDQPSTYYNSQSPALWPHCE